MPSQLRGPVLIFMGLVALQFIREQVARLRFDILLFLLLFCGPPRFGNESVALSKDAFDWSLLLQISVFLLAGIYLVFKWRPKLRATQILTVLLLAVFFLSARYSEQPAYTLFRAYQAAILFAFSAMFVEKHGIAEYLRWLSRAALVTCIFLIAWLLVNPDGVMQQELTGFPRFRGTSIVGTAEVATLLFVVTLARRSRFRWLLLVLSSTLIVFSLSRSAWLCAAIVVLLASLWKVWSTRWCRLALAGAAMFLVFANGPAMLANLRQVDNSTDLTGRDLLWAYMVSATEKESPWLGLGHSYASHMLASDFDKQLGTGHSLFIDAWAGSGRIGLVLTVILAIVVLWKAARLPRTAENFAVCALSISIIGLGLVSGANIDVGPFAFTYWALPSLVSAAPAS